MSPFANVLLQLELCVMKGLSFAGEMGQLFAKQTVWRCVIGSTDISFPVKSIPLAP